MTRINLHTAVSKKYPKQLRGFMTAQCKAPLNHLQHSGISLIDRCFRG